MLINTNISTLAVLFCCQTKRWATYIHTYIYIHRNFLIFKSLIIYNIITAHPVLGQDVPLLLLHEGLSHADYAKIYE